MQASARKDANRVKGLAVSFRQECTDMFRGSRPFRLIATALLLTASSALTACNLQLSNQAEAKSEWKKTYSLGASGSLEIKNVNGRIDVEPSTDGSISIVAERIAKAATDAEALKAAESIAITENVSSTSVALDAKMPITSMLGGGREVRFHVRAPKGTVLTLSSTNGEIIVRDMTGDLRLETTNGEIKGVNLEGSTRASTTNGSVNLDYALLGANGITAETTNGEVTVKIPKTTKASVNLRVTNGGISASGLDIVNSESSRKRLVGTMNGGGPEIRIETTNGAVVLRER